MFILSFTLSLADLADFIKRSDVNLSQGFLLQEGDYDGLIHVMGSLLKVKERQNATDVMFSPFQDIIDFLKNYDLDFPEEIFVQLQVVYFYAITIAYSLFTTCTP